MKISKLIITGLFAAQALLAANVFAEDAVKSYVRSSDGKVVKSGSGECVRTNYMSDVKPTECGYAAPAAPETMKVEVAERPTAASVTAIIKEEVILGAHMLFDFDSAELSQDARDIIDERINHLKGKLTLTSIMKVVGHTDSTGPEAYNQKLSEKRAQAVADYIAAHSKNVRLDDMKVIGMGESEPTASNAEKSGRAQNRRVVIHAEGHLIKE